MPGVAGAFKVAASSIDSPGWSRRPERSVVSVHLQDVTTRAIREAASDRLVMTKVRACRLWGAMSPRRYLAGTPVRVPLEVAPEAPELGAWARSSTSQERRHAKTRVMSGIRPRGTRGASWCDDVRMEAFYPTNQPRRRRAQTLTTIPTATVRDGGRRNAQTAGH